MFRIRLLCRNPGSIAAAATAAAGTQLQTAAANAAAGSRLQNRTLNSFRAGSSQMDRGPMEGAARRSLHATRRTNQPRSNTGTSSDNGGARLHAEGETGSPAVHPAEQQQQQVFFSSAPPCKAPSAMHPLPPPTSVHRLGPGLLRLLR